MNNAAPVSRFYALIGIVPTEIPANRGVAHSRGTSLADTESRMLFTRRKRNERFLAGVRQMSSRLILAHSAWNLAQERCLRINLISHSQRVIVSSAGWLLFYENAPLPFLLLSFLPRIRCETSLENATSSSRSVLQQNRRKANSGYGRLLLIRYRTLTILGEIVSFSKLTFWERAAFLRVPFFLSFFSTKLDNFVIRMLSKRIFYEL